MVLSDPINKSGIIQRAYFYAFGNSKDHTEIYPLADLVASVNEWLKKVGIWIWQASDGWSFDDSNYNTLPEATRNLVADQRDYSLPTDILAIRGVAVKDVNGNWILLKQIDRQEEMHRTGQDLEEIYKTSGLPEKYDIEGDSLLLYPAPDNGINVTLSGGLKIYLDRNVKKFSVPASYTTSDNTSPGFNENFHDILPLGAAFDYWLPNDSAKAGNYLATINSLKESMLDLYAKRNKDRSISIKRAIKYYL